MNVELLQYMGGDTTTVNAARVSFHKDASQFSEEQNVKLINYLAKHNHWSPFSHSFLQFRIKAPLFVRAQLAKHQVGLSWNEVSRRYVDDEPEFFFPEVWRGKPVNAKQGSSDVDPTPLYQEQQSTGFTISDRAEILCQRALSAYEDFIAAGVAPEQARMVLPLNTMTEWLWSGSLMAFARVCNQRLDPHAQLECQEVAKMIYDLVPQEFEHSWRALVQKTS